MVSHSQKPSLRNTTQQTNETSSRGGRQPVQDIGEETEGARSLEHEASTSMESSEAAGVQSTAASEESKSRVLKGTGIWKLPFVRTVMRLVELVIIRLSVTSGSKWIARHRKLPQNKFLFTGAFASVIVYAIFRNQHVLRR